MTRLIAWVSGGCYLAYSLVENGISLCILEVGPFITFGVIGVRGPFTGDQMKNLISDGTQFFIGGSFTSAQ